jgi:uncharacterized protein YkwD
MRLSRLLPTAAAALAFALLAGGLSPAPASAAKPCQGADRVPTVRTIHQARAAILCLLNVQRRHHGRHPLRADAHLRHAASSFSRAMVRGGFFAHVGPNGSTVATRNADYLRHARSWRIGENIAYGIGRLATPREITRAWMHSAGHRANILSPGFRRIGIGIALGAPGAHAATRAATYTTDFGARR